MGLQHGITFIGVDEYLMSLLSSNGGLCSELGGLCWLVPRFGSCFSPKIMRAKLICVKAVWCT